MNESPAQTGPKRESVAPRHESLKKEFEGDVGPQPREYGEARLWVVARDAHWVFAYWEFDPREHPEAGLGEKARFYIRIFRADGSEEVTQEISPKAGDLFIRVGHADAEYSAELGFFSPDGAWCFLTHSGTTRTPPETGREMVEPTADNGKGIRRLRALLNGEAPDGESPDTAAKRVRKRAAAETPWTPEREAMLARLLAADTARMAAVRRRRKG